MVDKHLIVWLFALVAPFSHGAEPPGVPAFRVFSPNGQSSVLIGTVHVPHAALRQPGASVLDGARALVIEHTTHDEPFEGFDPAAWAGMLEGKDVRAPWSRGLTEQHIARLVARYNCSAMEPVTVAKFEGLLKLRTARKVSELAFVPCAPRGMRSRDDLLAQAATQRRIPVVTLETQQEMTARRDRLPPRIHEASLYFALKLDLEQFYVSLIAAANRGDFDAIGRIATSDMTDAADRALFKRIMLEERNVAWIPTLRLVLDNGQAVVAVGAGHLAGKGGLIALLAQQGYRVEPITLRAAQ